MITLESRYLGLRNYNCTVPFEEILIRKSLLPSSEPISSDAVLKIETELKLERLEAVFAEMVHNLGEKSLSQQLSEIYNKYGWHVFSSRSF